MPLRLTRASYLDGYRFSVVFSDGHSGVVDLKDRLQGPVFLPLQNQAVFAQGTLDPEVGTLVWPGGVDLAPEYLLFRALPNAPELQQKYAEWGYVPRLAPAGP